jgi:RHS repeat-associated protein
MPAPVRLALIGLSVFVGSLAPLAAQVSVTPDGGSASAPENTPGNQVSFTVWNDGANGDYFSLVCTSGGQVTSCTPQESQVYVDAFNWTSVTVTYATGAAGTGPVTLAATGVWYGGWNQGYYNVTVTPVVVPGAPLVQTWPYFPELRDYGRCAVRGCFHLLYSQSTVPYFSLNTPRAITLIHNSERAKPMPFVQVDVKKDPSYGQSPLKFQLQVKVNGTLVTFRNSEQTLNFQHLDDGQYYRIGGQFDAAANGYTSTGVWPMQILVTAVYPSESKTRTINTLFVLVDWSNAPVARGWNVAEVQRMYTQADGSKLIVEGDGGAVYFKKQSGAAVWDAPAGEFSRVKAYGSGWRRYYPDSSKVTFSASGLMTSAQDAFGNTTTFQYDGSSRLWKVLDPENPSRVITLTYNASGLSSVLDPFGRTANLTVNASRQLTTFNPAVTTSFTYDAGNRIATLTDYHGYTTTFTYGANSGQLRAVTSPTTYVYGVGNTQLVSSLSPWDTVGVPYGPTGSSVTPARWDTIGGRVTDPGGHVIRFTQLNQWRQAELSYQPLGVIVTARYTSQGLLRHLAQPVGGIDSLAYDQNGLVVYQKLAGLTATYLRHHPVWQTPDSLWGVGQPNVRRYIGTGGRVDSMWVGDPFSKTRFSYDTRGRVTSRGDPGGHGTTYGYTGLNGNLRTVVRPGGRSASIYQDTYGRDTAVAEDGLPTRRTHFDALNRPTEVLDGVNGSPTSFVYDVAGSGGYYSVKVTDPKGQVYGEFVNSVGWVTGRQDPVLAWDLYQYDRDGLLRQWTTRRGLVISTAYDSLHRVTQRSGDSLPLARFGYQETGRIVTDSNAYAMNWTYLNVRGQPDSVRSRYGTWDFWRRYTYTQTGQLDSMWATGPAAAFHARKYTYDPLRYMLSTIALNGRQTQIERDLDGLPKSIRFPGSDVDTVGHMALHAENVRTTAAAYRSEVERKMGYDVAGRLWRHLREPVNRGEIFGYDGLNRLVQDTLATRVNPDPCVPEPNNGISCLDFWDDWDVDSVKGYAYDPAGNRTDNGGSYVTGNRILSWTPLGCSFQHDADGNRIRENCTQRWTNVGYEWDGEGRLMRVLFDHHQAQWLDTIKFRYDAVGRLVRKEWDATIQRYFLWDGDVLVAELNGADGSKVSEYSYYPGLDHLHALLVGDTAYYAHTDGAGNVIALTDTLKVVKRSYQYDPWGPLTGGSGSLSNVDRARFKGALWLGPEANLYYMRARWYEPMTGRFLSEDPIGLAGGINPYLFAGQDPIGGADPTGLLDCGWVGNPCRIRDGYVYGDLSRYDPLGLWEMGSGIADWLVGLANRGLAPAGDQGSPAVAAEGANVDVNPSRRAACRGYTIAAGFELGGTILFFTGWGATLKLGQLAKLGVRGGTNAAVRAGRRVGRHYYEEACPWGPSRRVR